MAFQTSSGSTRERWIKAFLPAAVILTIYMVLINLSRRGEVKALEKELSARRKNAVNENVLATLHAQNTVAARQRDQLNEQIEATERSIGASLVHFTGGASTERMLQVNDLCQQLSIGLLAQKPTTDVKVSQLREKSLQTLRKRIPKHAVSFRQLDLVGRYADMQTLLRLLPESIEGIVPLRIELIEKNSARNALQLAPGERLWRVYVLM